MDKQSKKITIAVLAYHVAVCIFIISLIIRIITTFIPGPVKTICPTLDTKNNRMSIRVNIDKSQKFVPDSRDINNLLIAITPANRLAFRTKKKETVLRPTYFSKAQVRGNYTIQTSYGNITLRKGAEVHLQGSGRKRTAIGQIYTRNFLTDTLQESLSLFSYDRGTGYADISGRKFLVTGFAVGHGATSLLFYIGEGTTLVIDDVEIQIPSEGAHLQIQNNRWALYSAEQLLDFASPFGPFGPLRNSLGIRLAGKQTDFTACNVIVIKPEWAAVEAYNVRDGGNIHTYSPDTLRSRLEWQELTEELYRIIRKK